MHFKSSRFAAPFREVRYLLLFSMLSAMGPAAASAAPGRAGASAPDPAVLDQKRIHTEYNEGNFERVTASIEGFMARNGTYSLDDSVFIAKHLAVVYSANPETREKGKYYMHRLLALVPSARLIDMYVSDEIERIFDKVREEFLARQKAFGVDSSGLPGHERTPPPRIGQADDGPAPRREEKPAASGRKRNLKPFYFAAGGAALVAAGVTAFVLLEDDPGTKEKIYAIE